VSGAPKKQSAPSHPARYDRRVGNPFSRLRKFSGKTASTRLQFTATKRAPIGALSHS
jgi:hypothetical protein